MCVFWGGGRQLLIDWLLKVLMKSRQPALQLAVRGPSGDEKRTAAEERGEEQDKGRRNGKNGDNHRGQEGELIFVHLKWGE